MREVTGGQIMWSLRTWGLIPGEMGALGHLEQRGGVLWWPEDGLQA